MATQFFYLPTLFPQDTTTFTNGIWTQWEALGLTAHTTSDHEAEQLIAYHNGILFYLTETREPDPDGKYLRACRCVVDAIAAGVTPQDEDIIRAMYTDTYERSAA